MPYAVSIVPVAPLRADSSHRAEMVSQLLLCEGGWILEETKDFIRLSCLHDQYEGWCQRSQLVIIDAWPASLNGSVLVGEWTAKVMINSIPAHAPLGAPIPDKSAILLGPYEIRYDNIQSWDAGTAAFNADLLAEKAKLFLNTSYLWGGRSVFGIDCSGFTQLIYRFFQFNLLRDAWQQATQGEAIGFLQEAACGDLAFFDNPEGRITHVGILLNDHTIIHSSGKVRIDNIDSEGIIRSDTRERTHKLRVIKRYFPKP